MAKVLTHMCMSLDGFVAQHDDNPAELFEWYWGGDVVVPSAQENMTFCVDAASAPMLPGTELAWTTLSTLLNVAKLVET